MHSITDSVLSSCTTVAMLYVTVSVNFEYEIISVLTVYEAAGSP